MDGFDRKILSLLQQDGRLTNNEIAEKIHLSASQCSRRRTQLEKSGLIKSYHALVDRDKAGCSLVSIVSVTLSTHNPDNANLFASLVKDLPNVLEAHALTGEMDYLVKIITPDLKSLSEFINEQLLPHAAVQNVKTSIVLETLKETTALPIG